MDMINSVDGIANRYFSTPHDLRFLELQVLHTHSAGWDKVLRSKKLLGIHRSSGSPRVQRSADIYPKQSTVAANNLLQLQCSTTFVLQFPHLCLLCMKLSQPSALDYQASPSEHTSSPPTLPAPSVSPSPCSPLELHRSLFLALTPLSCICI